jgi:hypothetical protein
VVNVSAPTIQGTGEAGDTITVREGATTLCTAVVSAAGTWSCVSSGLTDGAHTVVATASNSVAPAASSAADTFYVRTQPPSVPVITAPVAGSTVNTLTPAISGTGEAGDTLVVTEGATTLCSTNITAAGSWTCTSSALAQGLHTIVAIASNGIGPGIGSAADSFYVRTLPPPVPVISAPVAGSTVNTATPTVSGTGEPGDTIAIKEGAVTLCTATVNAAGNWSCTSSALLDGAHSVTATATNGVAPAAASAADPFYVRTKASRFVHSGRRTSREARPVSPSRSRTPTSRKPQTR